MVYLNLAVDFHESDIQSYFTQLNLPVPNVTAVSVDGTSNQPGADPDSDGEVMLDIEVAASLAPGASIVVYFAPFTEQGWVDAVSTAVHDTQHHPSVLSISWGYTEGQDIWTAQAVRAVNQAFQAAAVMGMTICAASGDDGSEDQLADGHAHVDFPASSPYVLACGGTYLEVANGVRTGERVWNNGQRANGGGAGGGGISDMNALPSWQQGIVPPSVNPNHHVGRGVPDVAGDADENSGYTILVDGQVASNVGGTSAVAPLWAALVARMNQQLGKPIGYLTPLLYTQLGKAGVLNDVTVGNNDPTGGRIGGYSAGRRLGCLHGLGNTERNEAAGGAGREWLNRYHTQRAAERWRAYPGGSARHWLGQRNSHPGTGRQQPRLGDHLADPGDCPGDPRSSRGEPRPVVTAVHRYYVADPLLPPRWEQGIFLSIMA